MNSDKIMKSTMKAYKDYLENPDSPISIRNLIESSVYWCSGGPLDPLINHLETISELHQDINKAWELADLETCCRSIEQTSEFLEAVKNMDYDALNKLLDGIIDATQQNNPNGGSGQAGSADR